MIPGASQAPKLCPAEPTSRTASVSSGNPSGPWRATSACASRPPTARSTLVTRRSIRSGRPVAIAGSASASSSRTSKCSSGGSGSRLRWRGASRSTVAGNDDQVGEVDQLALVALGLGRLGEQLDPADRVRDPGDPEPREVGADVLGDQAEVVDDVLGATGEARPQLGVLGRDPDRARVQVTDAHHDAAGGDQRARSRSRTRRRRASPRRARRGPCACRRRPAP